MTQMTQLPTYPPLLPSKADQPRKLAVLKDESDNRILECAISEKTELIVTGDRAMLNLVKYNGIRIVSLKKYLHSTFLSNLTNAIH